MIIVSVGRIHKNLDKNKWVLPYVRKTRKKTIRAYFEFVYYQAAKRKRKMLVGIVEENQGQYMSNKKRKSIREGVKNK